jgi:hypothetical protein
MNVAMGVLLFSGCPHEALPSDDPIVDGFRIKDHAGMGACMAHGAIAQACMELRRPKELKEGHAQHRRLL